MRLTILLLSVLITAIASATTWDVRKDGLGDATVIQDAVNAAASGDSILIHPGEYNDVSLFQLDCCQSDSVTIGISQSELTIIGAHRDSVIIGPEILSLGLGVAMNYNTAEALVLERVTIRNRVTGVWLFGQSRVSDVRIVGCGDGIFTIPNGALIDAAILERCAVTGIAAAQGGRNLHVRDSEFLENDVGIDFFDSAGAIVEGCEFSGCGGGINVGDFADPIIRDCTIVQSEGYGIALVHDSSAKLYDNFVQGDFAALFVLGVQSAVAHRNTFVGGSNSAIRLSASCSLDIRENNILNGTGQSVYLRLYSQSSSCQVLDLGHNYWYTSDPDSVDGLIWDGNDDPALSVVVDYDPLLDALVPRQSISTGSMKAIWGQ